MKYLTFIIFLLAGPVYAFGTPNKDTSGDGKDDPKVNYTISGRVVHAITNEPFSGATVYFSGLGQVTTNTQGDYWKQVAEGWTGEVYVSVCGYQFSPQYNTYSNVSQHYVNQNFVESQPPGWKYTCTGSIHIISIYTTANPNICGTPLQEGDYIGAFYVGDDGQLHCGGVGRLKNGVNTGVFPQGNDPYTPEKDGFNSGETMNWRVLSLATMQEYVAYPVYNGSGTAANNKWYPMGMSTIGSFPAYKTQYLEIPQGWSGIGSYMLPAVVPPDATPKITTIMAPILSKLVILKNLTQMYWPAQSINTIVNWNVQSGYMIKLTSPATLPINGCASATRTVNLVPTWNLLPVISECYISVQELFGPVMDKITIIKEVAGTKVFWPAKNVTTLQMLENGKAYLVAVTSNCSVTYPACGWGSEGALKQIQENISMIPLNELAPMPSDPDSEDLLLSGLNDENAQNAPISIFHDPTGSKIHLVAANQNENFKMSIYSISGINLKEKSFTGTMVVDTATLPKGVCIVHVEENGHSSTVKLMIE